MLSDDEFDRQVSEISRQAMANVVVPIGGYSQKRLEEALHRACVPKRFLRKSFDNFDASGIGKARALEICKRYADSFNQVLERGTCLVLTGDVGTGKTHLAMAVLSHVLAQDASGMYVTVSEMLRHIRSTFSVASEETEQQVFDDFILVDLLVVDEVGVAIGDQEKRQALLFDIINGRYNLNKPTIVLGNLTPKEMERYLSDRVWDRLIEHRAPIIKFDWKSYRGR